MSGATEAFKQKSTVVRFVLGQITGRNVHDRLDGGED